MDEPDLDDVMVVVSQLDLNKSDASEQCSSSEKVKDGFQGMKTPRATVFAQDETPGGSVNWEPRVHGIRIPEVGDIYDTLEEAFDMYSNYAEKGGFEVKKSGQSKTKSGMVKHKYITCNKGGKPIRVDFDTLDPKNKGKQIRNTTHHVTGCKAQIKLQLNIVTGKYKLVQFIAKHNHHLLPEVYQHYTKKQRKMPQAEKMFVVKAAANKLGATRAHNFLSSIKGGDEYVHGTTADFKNAQRDVTEFIGENDAQMLINKMENRKLYVPNFTFEYKVENDELVAMFWADEVAKCYYKEFGDIVSFDATFNSNRYNMKFVPFTGIDNHRKCVTLGSGMILHEDTESYTWLLTAFLSAVGKEPTMIVTDQDGAMKRAIEAVFKTTKHRLCMWHISQKIPSKICEEIYKGAFKERFDRLIWNMFIEPKQFEERWGLLIDEFELKENKWMKKMYDLRKMWIPAYFIDSPLFGLMRTTSRSESENSFFKSFTSQGSTLVGFMMSYESAMERQRHRQENLDFQTLDAAPTYKTMLDIERHAARIYTKTIFEFVQHEINAACWNCTIQGLQNSEGCETFIIRDKAANSYRTIYTKSRKEQDKEIAAEKATEIDYKVLRVIEDGSVVCSCRHFLRYGFLCRHIFCVFKNRDVNVIPKEYILRRWTREIIPPELRRQINRYGEKNVTVERLSNEVNFVVDDCLFLLSKDEERLAAYLEKLKVIYEEIKVDMPNPLSRKTADVIGDLFAISEPDHLDVNNPTKARNKGDHPNDGKKLKKGERLKSGREKALKVRKKPLKVCGYCKVKTREHTKRTCPKNPNAKKKKASPIIDV